ncbi:iron-containing alcohol dehydrogenase [Pirellula staleyi DSM 6068]|uniref:Iron-containing alcohol dehydrogenase n=1 Tax=Pirellula staleyi (strain ATCC 27377 / DSM 6068 / ICPB 4128) TaxID=530564 RepID=D2R658_PIRSD|nr:iron-containing alcohol dehydrogenase [Pirellula staleyi]ADB19143.1 iron-containing alcohol dehydrogenase [Pirellula staleyi DSM 6068]
MQSFDFQPRTRIVFGPGKIEALGQLASEIGARRALVVSDPGVVAAGHTARGIASLEAAGIETHLFDGLAENPSTDDVAAGVKIARRYEPQLLIGLGGGSSMDCAKGINFIYTGGGEMKDYWGVGKALKEMLPMIAIPTTAGTGSETQSFALISDAKTHAKMACGDKKASCRVALLDPELTVTQPARVTALTGIDAISHALETFVTKKRNAASLAFSRESWRLLASHFAQVLAEPTNIEARGSMLLGASLAGLAIENSMLGAAHALANPLTAHYNIPHGQAVGVMLPHVIRFNGEQFAHWYVDLLSTRGDGDALPGPSDGVEGLAQFVTSLVEKSGLSTTLTQLKVDPASLETLAGEAAKQWTATFNPREVSASDLAAIYRAAI